MRITKILYIGSVDIGEPVGPSVNEREFVLALHRRFGDQARFVVPKTQRRLAELAPLKIDYVAARRKLSRPLDYLAHETAQAHTIKRVLSDFTPDMIVARPEFLPLGLWNGVKGSVAPLALRHVNGKVLDFDWAGAPLRTIAMAALSPLDVLIQTKLARRAISLDTPTPGHRRKIIAEFQAAPEKIFVLDNSTNTERFKPGDRNAARLHLGLERFDPLVGYIGGAPWERAGKYLLQAAPALLARHPDMGFLVIGGGKGLNRLRAEVAAAGLEDRFQVPGYIPYEEVPTYTRALDLGVAFDRPARVAEGGNANQKIRQYIACGIPVVTNRADNSFIGNHDLGGQIDPTEEGAVAAAILHWLDRARAESDDFVTRARDIAVTELSVNARVQQCIEFWTGRLEREHTA